MQFLDVPELSVNPEKYIPQVNHLPAAVGMSPALIKDFDANFHLHSFTKLPGALRRPPIGGSNILVQFWYIPV